jgi:hypothetical protein
LEERTVRSRSELPSEGSQVESLYDVTDHVLDLGRAVWYSFLLHLLEQSERDLDVARLDLLNPASVLESLDS